MSDVQCEQHGGTIRNADHEFVCCVQEQWSISSYEGKSTERASYDPDVVASRRAIFVAGLEAEGKDAG